MWEIYRQYPVPVITVLVVLLIFFYWILILLRHKKYKREITEFKEHGVPLPVKQGKAFIRYLDRFIEKKAKQGDLSLLPETGREGVWIRNLMEHPNKRNLRRVINYLPQKGLFAAFFVSLKKKKLQALILKDVEERGLLPLASSCNGKPFDGKVALAVFAQKLEEIREMTGHPLWNVRYFALTMLVEDPAPKSLRAVEEALDDPHPLIRRLAVTRYRPDKVDIFKDFLMKTLLKDGNQEVRRGAFMRIKSEYPPFVLPDLSLLTTSQILHLIEFLDPGDPKQLDSALRLLQGDNWEIRMPAALFLARIGRLRNMMMRSTFEDKDDLERLAGILIAASEVQVLDFLSPIPNSPASLYLGLRVLESTGSEELCIEYCKRAFKLENSEEELWLQAVKTLDTRNFTSAHQLLASELKSARNHPQRLSHLLDTLPENSSKIIADVLLDFLNDPTFPLPEKLITAFIKTNKSLWLSPVISILKDGRELHPYPIRTWAFRLLGEAKANYTLSFLMEQLPVLPAEEHLAMAEVLGIFREERIIPVVEELLAQTDGQIRTSLLSSLPVPIKKHFSKDIKESLGHPDPQVRIAAMGALVDIGETKGFSTSLDLLRDPMEEVRRKAAQIIGQYGSEKGLEKLEELLIDETEVDEVKRMGIYGICFNPNTKPLEILVNLLDKQEDLSEMILEEMAALRNPKHLSFMVKAFKDADPSLRSKIQSLFQRVGLAIEPFLEELVKEDVESLKTYLGDILYETGYIEHIIRRLKHRNVSIRRNAAAILSLFENKAAFRGIILAARDPDEEVRIQVTRALEHLASKEGKILLDELLQDPDKRVRKFTQWALQRVLVKQD